MRFNPRALRISTARYVVLGTLVVIAIVYADVPVSAWVREQPFPAWLKFSLRLVRLPGTFGFTLALAALLLWWGRLRRSGAAGLLAGGAIASLAASLIKIACGRHRPSHAHRPFDWTPLWERSASGFLPGNLSFPSGDATLAFATAALLAHRFPRIAAYAYAWASAVAVTRVLQGVHYPSDVLAGAFVGLLAAEVTLARFRDALTPPAGPALGPSVGDDPDARNTPTSSGRHCRA